MCRSEQGPLVSSESGADQPRGRTGQCVQRLQGQADHLDEVQVAEATESKRKRRLARRCEGLTRQGERVLARTHKLRTLSGELNLSRASAPP